MGIYRGRVIWLQSLLGLMAVALVSGCIMVGPDYVKPSAPEPAEWIEEEDPRIKDEPTDISTWWRVFDDPVLDSLVQSAYQQNLPLQIAGVRILEARAQLGVAVGFQYPQQQQALGELTRVNLSENRANTLGGDLNYTDAFIGLDAAWELDIWGKFRRGVESSIGDVEASIANYDDILVSLTGEVARTYVQFRTFEERLRIAWENVKIQKRSLEIAEARFEAGAVTELDVTQARSLLRDTEASIPRFERGIRQTKNALAILLGTLPGEIDELLAEPKPIPAVPTEVAVGIPTELLRRRPDIRLAERQLAGQSALIGFARADLYPHFSLFGSIGLAASDASFTKAGGRQGSELSDLWDAKSWEIFFGPSVRWDILNYGRITNKVRVEDARFQELAVNYQNTVLEAVREAEDAIVAFLRTEEEAAFLFDSVEASKRSVDLSMIQYREGLVDYQRVLDTQRFLTNQQDVYTQTRGDVDLSLISLYKALGGGWEIRIGKDFVPEEIKAEMQERTNWGRLLSPDQVESPVSEEHRKRLFRSPDW